MSNIYDKCPYVTTQRALQGKWAIIILVQALRDLMSLKN